jgi:hypoxanthine phosphoribosyltransferase
MNYVPDRIVGLSRGGLIPGVIISHLMGIPFSPVAYSSKNGAGDNRNHDAIWTLPVFECDNILIVDDICDTSLTLAEITSYYRSKGIIVYTAVLHYKTRTNGQHVPDFYWKKIPEDSGWVVYPFEKADVI